jgi:ADP-ribose pyrophosphatase YjhB (NUDIX family)
VKVSSLIDILPIAISILKIKDKYLFIKRRRHPYKGLWSLVGGKINVGEHVRDAAIREIKEETGVSSVNGYEYRGFVSERLLEEDVLRKHFFIFVGYANISQFQVDHREGVLRLFQIKEIVGQKNQFLPSDWHMFHAFETMKGSTAMYEAELIYRKEKYELAYFRKVGK